MGVVVRIKPENTHEFTSERPNKSIYFIPPSYLSFTFLSGFFIVLLDPYKKGILPICGCGLVAGYFSRKGTLLLINSPKK